jgi:hypothetical protein
MNRRFSATALSLLACSGLMLGLGQDAASASAGTPLVGTFKLSPGACFGDAVTGTYFRMILAHGNVKTGPFFGDPDSGCPNKTFILATPGAGGGFATGKFQPNPKPAFNAQGGALADQIIQPQSFSGIDFSLATSPKDPQTGTSVPAPHIVDTKGKLSGQIEAWSVSWNKTYFNLGSPKPNGAYPGLTRPVTGTYNATTHAYVLTWTSQVTGGPFNGFTGYWHLAGTFVKAKGSK